MRSLIFLSVIVLLFLTACTTTFNGVTPIYPKVQVVPVGWFTKVDSIQPTLRWEPSSYPDISYDLVIYEAIKMGDGSLDPGKMAYSRKSLKDPEHKVEEPLKANSKYYWSVRTRSDTIVSAWSRYDYFVFMGTAWAKGYNQLFRFKTPKE